MNIDDVSVKLISCLEFLTAIFTRLRSFFVNNFMFVSAMLLLKSFSTDVTRVSCGMSCLSVVDYVFRLDPQATIIAPIKLLQHNRVRFNVMLQV